MKLRKVEIAPNSALWLRCLARSALRCRVSGRPPQTICLSRRHRSGAHAPAHTQTMLSWTRTGRPSFYASVSLPFPRATLFQKIIPEPGIEMQHPVIATSFA